MAKKLLLVEDDRAERSLIADAIIDSPDLQADVVMLGACLCRGLFMAGRARAAWTTLPVAEIAKLRRIKNRLGVIAQVADHLNEQESRELQPWLELRARLP